METQEKLHIADVLKTERIKKGNSQEDLAIFCGVTKSSVSKWEKGISHPSLIQLPQILPQIADFYDITIQKLLTGKEV